MTFTVSEGCARRLIETLGTLSHGNQQKRDGGGRIPHRHKEDDRS